MHIDWLEILAPLVGAGIVGGVLFGTAFGRSWQVRIRGDRIWTRGDALFLAVLYFVVVLAVFLGLDALRGNGLQATEVLETVVFAVMIAAMTYLVYRPAA